MTSSKLPSAMTAEVHHDRPVDHRSDHAQIVLDQEDGHAPLALEHAQHLGQLLGLVDVQTRGRLVGQQQHGSETSARASSTSRHEPRPRDETGASARSPIPTSSSTASTRSFSSAVGALRLHRSFHRRPCRWRARSATKRWSRTVMSGKTSTRW